MTLLGCIGSDAMNSFNPCFVIGKNICEMSWMSAVDHVIGGIAFCGFIHLLDGRLEGLSSREVAIRFDGSLYFANVAYFEDAILEAVSNHPEARYVLVVGDGINQLDASGEEVIHHLVDRLKGAGITLVFSGLKKQVLDVMRATGLFDVITQANIFPTEDHAIAAIYERLGEAAADDLFCAVSPAR